MPLMKNCRLVVGLFCVLTVTGCMQDSAPPALTGPYMGQSPPGSQPAVFLPGLLNTAETGAFCTVFTPAGDEFYFVHYTKSLDDSGAMKAMRQVEGSWTDPEPLPFTIRGADNDMCLSIDGNRMIFRSWRPLPDGTQPEGHSWLWFSDRTADGWTEAKPFLCGGRPVRTGYPSMSADGTVYFAHRRDKILGIYRSVLLDGKYGEPEWVYTLVNNSFIIGDMFVAPDESYMIISGKDPVDMIGHGGLDLYITFRLPDGSWSEAANLGDGINTGAGENCPQVSPDGRYLFFNRYDAEKQTGDMYWIDAAVLHSFR
jgi:hypothetical protein